MWKMIKQDLFKGIKYVDKFMDTIRKAYGILGLIFGILLLLLVMLVAIMIMQIGALVF